MCIVSIGERMSDKVMIYGRDVIMINNNITTNLNANDDIDNATENNKNVSGCIATNDKHFVKNSVNNNIGNKVLLTDLDIAELKDRCCY